MSALDELLIWLFASPAPDTVQRWDEACEGLARAHGRPGVPVIAACVAHGLRHDLRLGDLLDAVIAGYEVGGRMGEWLRMRSGMHVDASWPSLGVAVALTRLAGGSARVARSAVEIAASQVPFSLLNWRSIQARRGGV